MRAGRSGKPGRTPLLEIWEMNGGILTDTPGSISSPRALYSVGNDAQTIQALYTLGGGALPFYATRNGHWVRQFQPGSAQIAAATLGYGLPLGRQVGQYPASFRPQRRIVWETVFERSNPLVGTGIAEIGVRDDPGNNIDAVNSLGLVIRSSAAVNAGRWTLMYKPDSGAVVTGADSGVSPFALRHIKFEYYDMVTPVLNIYIDGTLRITVPASILTTLCTLNTNEPLPIGVQSGDPGATIGQVDYQYESHFLIESI